ncbi:MAG: cell division protein FtsB [Caulobacter sp.]|nr:cell division protein FtsB [Vitreoscilla sp.]
MRLVTIALIVLIAWVQAELWFGKAGFAHVQVMRSDLATLRAANDVARQRNDQLQAEVSDLKEGLEMVEEKARSELGMTKPDEILVVLTPGK